MASSAEKARLWRERHPVEAAAALDKIKGKPRRKKDTATVLDVDTAPRELDTVVDGETLDGDMSVDTAKDTALPDHGQGAPDPAALGTNIAPLDLDARSILRYEIEALLLLRAETLPVHQRTNLAKTIGNLLARYERLPKPTVGAVDWLSAYRQPVKPPRARRKAVLPAVVEIVPAPMSG